MMSVDILFAWHLFDKALCDRLSLIMIVASYVNHTGEESDE